MPLLIPPRISREFIQNHTDWIFVYGSVYTGQGVFGQAWVATGEPNAFPVPTMLKHCQSSTDRYFFDGDYHHFTKLIDEKIAEIPRDSRPIIPFPKIGRGHSELWRRAPQVYIYLLRQLALICTEVEYDWNWQKYTRLQS